MRHTASSETNHPMPRTTPEGPNPVDIHIGKAICARRISGGYNQSDLGRAVGLTFQQIQKYEKGSNRVSGSKLFQFAAFFGCEPGDFFPTREQAPGGLMSKPAASADFFTLKGSVELAERFIQLSHSQRMLLLSVANGFSDKAVGEPVRLLPGDDRPALAS